MKLKLNFVKNLVRNIVLFEIWFFFRYFNAERQIDQYFSVTDSPNIRAVKISKSP